MRLIDAVTLFAAIANLGIGLFVLTRNYKRTLYLSFAGFSIVTGLWVLSNFLFAVVPSKFLLETQYSLGSIVLPISLIWFIIFLDNKIRKSTLFLLGALSLLLLIIPYLNSLIIEDFEIIGEHEYILEFSNFFDYYSLVPISFFLALLVKLFQGYRRESGIKKVQLKYILAGATGFGGVSLFVSFILPFFNISIVAPFDAQSSLIFVGFSLYAIVRHRLLDLRIIITRSLVYGVLLSVVTLSFVLITFTSAQFFGDTASSRNTIAFIVAVLIVFGLDPLKTLLSRATDRVFFKARVDYQLLLREISEIVGFEINRDELIIKVREKLQNGLKVKFAVTLLRQTVNGRTDRFEALPDKLEENPNFSLDNDSALVQFLREHKHFSIVESLDRKIEDTPSEKRKPLIDSRKEFERLGASLVTPIYAQGHLIAVLALGPKLSGDSFSNEDINLIEVLSPQIGSAIQKALLFEEVRQFNIGLQQKVDEATRQLREKNVSLETLQHINKEITQTLDFSRVVQQIADSVATELGYLGAILAFLDDDGKTSRARAITQTPLTKSAIKLLPKSFTDYTTDISNEQLHNLGTKVYQTGEIQMTNSFARVVSPPLPKLLAQTIQKILGMKSMVIIPIVSEGKTIGVIEIGTKKDKEDISQQELETMQSVADELGIVSRNLKLFGQLQQTNQQLEVANKHLQELDKAKSEFVSIASHQLRTPMTGIMGYLSMMTQGDFGKLKPEHSDILRNLLAESQRMIRLINQFLNVSKIEAGKFTYTKQKVHLEELVKREVDEVQKVAKDKGLKVSLELPKKALPEITADGDKLQDVILNLIDNAIKYTEQGTITIGVAPVDDHVRFWVKDSGIGIKKEDASELFNKFVRGSGIAQIHPDGSGLGLFIAKSIIDAHGGQIWAESEGEGKGSTFQFVIPLQPPPELDAPSQSAAAHIVSTKRT